VEDYQHNTHNTHTHARVERGANTKQNTHAQKRVGCHAQNQNVHPGTNKSIPVRSLRSQTRKRKRATSARFARRLEKEREPRPLASLAD